MPRSVTVTFADGSSFMYDDVPDTVTPNQVEERATRDFPDRQIVEVFGGDRMVSEMREAIASGQATMDDLRGIAQRYNRDIENPEAAQYWLDYAADNPGAEIPENLARPPVGRMEATLSGIERNLRPFGEFAEKLNPLSYVTDLVEDLIAPGRRQERETAIENRLAADAARAEAQRPNWFAGGQIAGDVIGTAPAIFMGGAGLAGAGLTVSERPAS